MIEKCLTLSTGHMPESAPYFGDMRTSPHHYGDILFITRDLEHSVPEWLLPIYKVAIEDGCTMIMFDRDADEDERFKVYEWETC